MSLHDAAKHLAAHGRGDDKVLIHMTKGEIDSLQHFAKANGGTLTVNPHTGLKEAGFLSSLLPMAMGAASTYFTGNPYLDCTTLLLLDHVLHVWRHITLNALTPCFRAGHATHSGLLQVPKVGNTIALISLILVLILALGQWRLTQSLIYFT